RKGPAGRPAAQEDRAGGHSALSGARDVGAAEAGDRLAGERGPGRVATGRARRRGLSRRAAPRDTKPYGPPQGEAFFRRKPPQPGVKGVCGERTPGKQAVARARSGWRGNVAKFVAADKGRSEGFHVKTEGGTQVASRGPTWRSATPLV